MLSSDRRLNVVFMEPFFGGSHRAFAEGLKRHSQHSVELISLPARFWKWRMRGAALEFARRLRERVEQSGVDVIVATSLLDLAHLLALLPSRIPSLLYFHENQVSYPPQQGKESAERDLQYAFTNLASALAADRVAFNSAFQRDAFFTDLRGLLSRMPDARPMWAVDELTVKTKVASLGVELSDIGPRATRQSGAVPVILWNHRWEYDKAPDDFFGALEGLANKGIPFRIAVAGESYTRAPEAFGRARTVFGSRILHWGFIPDRTDYLRLLAQSDFVVSTAIQENFGLSIVEATYAGAHPLAPRRLSYPEVIPESLHGQCLYDGVGDLAARLESLLTGRAAPVPAEVLRVAMEHHSWGRRIEVFDELIRLVFGSKWGVPVV